MSFYHLKDKGLIADFRKRRKWTHFPLTERSVIACVLLGFREVSATFVCGVAIKRKAVALYPFISRSSMRRSGFSHLQDKPNKRLVLLFLFRTPCMLAVPRTCADLHVVYIDFSLSSKLFSWQPVALYGIIYAVLLGWNNSRTLRIRCQTILRKGSLFLQRAFLLGFGER